MSLILSEIAGEPHTDSAPRIWAGFQAYVDSHPGALALACAHQPASLFGLSSIPLSGEDGNAPYLRWTYGEFHEGIHRVIAAWRALGVKEGSMLMTFAQNGAEWMLAVWAALKMGCILMPISPRNLINAEEITHMVKTGLFAHMEMTDNLRASGDHTIVLAGTNELAGTIDELDLFPQALKLVVTDNVEAANAGWLPFGRMMDSSKAADVAAAKALPAVTDQGGSVLFTSGTTSLPKGVFMTHERNYSRPLYGLAGIGEGSKVSIVMPNNHAMGYLVMTMCLMAGAAVIFPGPAFDPTAMLESMYVEEATHTVLVPTMIYALVAAKGASSRYSDLPLSHLKNVMLAGAGVATDHLRMVMQELGADGAENFYGSTEGLICHSGAVDASNVASITDGEDVSVGLPLAGYRVKIVDPETGETVPRNVFGEIHGFGWCMPEPYIGGVGKDTWYSDLEGQRWYKSGDQGRMDEKGRLFVTGRYKDMIIRGGENISPGAIEAILSKHPLLSPLVPQIVGAKDNIAGEVPVAVINGEVTAEIRATIQHEIIQHMGALYLPEDVISTKDLGLADYPRTTSGKIQKMKVRNLVDRYLSQTAKTDMERDLVAEIRTIWARAVGLDPSHIRLDAPIQEFADSITTMRVREKIKKQTGKVLSLAAMAEAGTIEKQIKLLQSMEVPSKEIQMTRVERPKRDGPPGVEDMAHLTEDPDQFEPTKKLVVKTISNHGFEWDDVEDIIPAYDFVSMMAQTRKMDSWTWEFALHPTIKLDKTQLRRASEAVIANNRILASYLVWDPDTLESDVGLHVVVKQTNKFFDLIYEDGGELATLEDLRRIPETHPGIDSVNYPGPMWRVRLYDIKEMGQAALLVTANHAIMDASMMQLLQEDFDRAFALAVGCRTSAEIVSQLPAHVDYKVWADSYYNLRTSSEARAATKWHVKRLKSINDHVKAVNLLSPKPQASRGPYPARFKFEVPELHKLRREHPSITPVVLMKAAVALVDVERTGHTHAIIHNLEAARTHFPFLSKSVMDHASASSYLEGGDVSGPTFQMVFNVVEVDRGAETTALGFLERMQEEQTGLTTHASAPLKEIMKELNKISPGSGEALPWLVHSPQFNWPPGLTQIGTEPFSNLKLVNAVNRPTTGFIYHAGLGGDKSQTIFLDVYGAQVGDEEEASLLGRKTMAIAKWLATSANWNMPVSDFTKSLSNLC